MKPTDSPLMPVSFQQLLQPEHMFSAWRGVRSPNSASGPDGMSWQVFETRLEQHLSQLILELAEGRYQPGEIKIVQVPNRRKTKTRPIGLLNMRDRVLHRALHDLLDPVLDPLFLPCSYAFRKGVSMGMALMRIRELTKGIFNWVIAADIEKCFESVCHAPLRERLYPLVNDVRLCQLLDSILQQWSQAMQQQGYGILQGSSLSPLLANFYLHVLDYQVNVRSGYHYVRYCDDFVLLGRSFDEVTCALAVADEALEALGMALKTRKIRLSKPGEKFHFLGMDFRLSRHTAEGIRPKGGRP